jgi:hypothetical protein
MNSTFAVTKHDDGDGVARLAVRGEIDRDVSEALATMIANAAGRPGMTGLVIDLDDVPFLAAAGIRQGRPGKRPGAGAQVSHRLFRGTRPSMTREMSRRRGESERQRWDRNFADLLQELRVAQTGVQILFAFLLTLPFSNGFPKTTEFQKVVYVVALISAAFAAAMIISPVAFHRALFRQGRKPELVRFAHRMATAGLGFTLVSMVASILLITAYLLTTLIATILTAVAATWFLVFWAIVPVIRRNWIDEDAEEEDLEVNSDEDGHASAVRGLP